MRYSILINKKNFYRYRNIYSFLLFWFIFFSLVSPLFFINKILFLLIFTLYIIETKVEIKSWAPLCITFIFVLGLTSGIIRGFDKNLALQFLMATIIFYLIFPIVHVKIDMSRIIKQVFILVEVFYLIYFIYVFNNYNQYSWPLWILSITSYFDNNLINFIGHYIDSWGATAVGFRDFGTGSLIMIHLGSVPFTLIPIGLYSFDFFNNKDKLKSFFLLLCAIIISIFSTSRALLICEIFAIIFAFMYSCQPKSLKIIVLIVLIVLVSIIFVFLFNYTSVFSLSDEGNSIKLGHIDGYLKQLNPFNAICGNGLATYYYSTVFAGFLAHTEITLLDFIRYFGIPFGIFIYFIFLFPNFKLKKDFIWSSYHFILFLLYLMMSLSNPVLFNSIGGIVILYYWSNYYMQNSMY